MTGIKIAIGGMIASGKSTLSRKISDYLEIPLMEEYEKDDDIFNTLLKWLYEGKPNTEMLLQVYFLHAHWMNQKKFGDSFVVDRDLIEHWLFAHKNLQKYPEVLNMYNGLFYAYMNSVKKPDLYIILDMEWETFKERIFKRGRVQETENFENNESYFKELISDYVPNLVAQCQIHNIPYKVFKVDYLNEDILFEQVKLEIQMFGRIRKIIIDVKQFRDELLKLILDKRDGKVSHGDTTEVTYLGETYTTTITNGGGVYYRLLDKNPVEVI